jgi:uncharacterized protein YbjT (DUF2867 family)
MEGLAIVKAHEDFVTALRDFGIPHTVIRPTGYFSDISEYFKMAQSGRAYLIGKGENHLNPIHGADLAEVCVAAVDDLADEVAAGGPSVYSQREIAELAFTALNKSSKIYTIPIGLARAAVKLTRIFDPHQADLFDFFVNGADLDMVAPKSGCRSLDAYFSELATSSIGNEGLNDLQISHFS